MAVRSAARIVLAVMAFVAFGCSVKLPPHIEADLAPPDGTRPNNFELVVDPETHDTE